MSHSKSTLIQVAVGVAVGAIVGIMSGSGTAFLMVKELEKKVDVHMAQNIITEAQLRRDIVRLEQHDFEQGQEMAEFRRHIVVIDKNMAVIAKTLEGWEAIN